MVTAPVVPVEPASLPTAMILTQALPEGLPVFNSFGCVAPPGWVGHVIQPGETLYSIAVAAQSEIIIIAQLNCIPDTAPLPAGTIIFLPRQIPPLPTLMPVFPGTAPFADPRSAETGAGLLTVSGCDVPGVRIASPRLGQIVSGPVTITGSAISLDPTNPFSSYTLEVRPALGRRFTIYTIGQQAVEFGVLGVINADWFGEGLHYLRLVVNGAFGPIGQPCDIPVIFGAS
jgi:hypothetical protein